MEPDQNNSPQENAPKSLEELQELCRSHGLKEFKVSDNFGSLQNERKQEILGMAEDFVKSLSEKEIKALKHIKTDHGLIPELKSDFENELKDFREGIAQKIELDKENRHISLENAIGQKAEEQITPPSPLLQQEGESEKEKFVFGIDEIKNIITSQISGKAEINRLDILKETGGLRLNAELDAGLTGGKIAIDGLIVNSGNEIAISNLNIDARGYVKSMIEKNLSNFFSAVKSYFEKQNGKPISKIQIVGSNLEIEFENTSKPEPTILPQQPTPEPISVARPPSAEVPASKEENVLEDQSAPEKSPIEEWEEFKKLRNNLAEAETRTKKETNNKNLDEVIRARSEYEAKKQAIAEIIKNTMQAEAGEGLTPEQKAELHSKINDKIFEELVVSEHEVYMKELRNVREETWKDKAIEIAKSALSSVAFKWYLSQNKFVRIGITTLLATGIGYGIGTIAATGAVGYAGARIARGVLSLEGAAVGRLVGSKIKRWDIENVNEWEKQKEEEIKNSPNSLEGKSMELRKIKEKADKERRKRALKKSALTVGLGAGAGLLAGVSEHFYSGVSKPSVLEHTGGKKETLQGFMDRQNVPIRPKPNLDDLGKTTAKGFNPLEQIPPTPEPTISRPEPEQFKVSVPESVKLTKSEINPELNPEQQFRVSVTKPIETLQAKAVAETPVIPAEKIFENPDNLEHIKVEGNVDSGWKVIEKGFEDIEEFRNFTRAQKDNVISFFNNKAINNPGKYGFVPDEKFGIKLRAGEEINLKKLLSDPEEIKKVLSRANNLTETQQQDILKLRAQIETYHSTHPNEFLTLSKVHDILDTKPRAPIEEFNYEQKPSLEELGDSTLGVENQPAEIPEPVNPRSEPTLEDLPKSKVLQEQIEKDIAGYKQQLQNLEKKSMMGDILAGQEVEKAFRNAVDSVYGQHGFFRNVNGVETKEWGFIRGLEANKVLNYFRNPESLDLQKSLPAKVLTELGNSEKHRQLVEQVTSLMDKANELARERGGIGVDFKPFDNGETVEAFIKRLGAFLMRKK